MFPFDKLDSEIGVLRQRSEDLRDRINESVEVTNNVCYDIYMAQRDAPDTLLEHTQ
jgi:hypothetical protein